VETPVHRFEPRRPRAAGDWINWPQGVVSPAAPAPPPEPARPVWRRLGRMTGWCVGLVALPLTLVPFWLYAHYDQTGNLLALRAERKLATPSLTPLPAAERTAYAAGSLRYADAVVTLALSGVGRTSGSDAGTMTLDRLSGHLGMLRAAGFNTVTPRQVADWHAGRAHLPTNALLLTFDGGRVDTVLNAAPLVRQAGMRASVFVQGGAFAKAPVFFASPDQLRKLQHHGWSIEALAQNGAARVPVAGGAELPYMSARKTLPDGAVETIGGFRTRVAHEYVDAHHAAQTISGVPPVAYAWPFGAYGADHRTNDDRIDHVNTDEARNVYAISFNEDDPDAYVASTRSTDAMQLRRLRINPSWKSRELWERLQVAIAASAPEADHAS
jgi:peptidoglycan/xylan/chitin deacetylase (PgdA/CDA1 family)